MFSSLRSLTILSHHSRYNLKRRVASLPPISAEAFTEKVLQARAQTTAEADKAFFEKTCQVCEKTYYSENSFQNHLSSQKHRAREARGIRPSAAIPDETSSVMSSTFSLGEPVKGHHDDDDDEEEDELESASAEAEFNKVVEGLQKTTVSDTRPSPVKRPSNPQATTARKDSESRESNGRDSGSATPTPSQPDPSTLLQQCLFCRYMSPTVNLNAHHMERFHGMVIPEKEYLVDLDGLIKYLASKVYEDFECLTCGKAKSNAFAAQTHMRDVGHCTIPYTTEEEQLEIGDFYDFRSTYSDDEEDEGEEEESGYEPLKIDGTKLGAKRSESAIDENGEEISVEEDGWETDSSASSFDSEELTAVPADDRQNQYERLNKSHHHSHEDPRQHHLADGWHSHAHKHNARSVFHDDYELHLPSGKSVGHRSLNRYYRQNLHNYPTAEERAERERLAIENGEANGDEQPDGEGGPNEANRNRAVIPRTQQGIMGVTDQAKGQLARDIHQSRKIEQVQGAKRDMAYSTKLNKQKNYYYRYERGG